MKAILHRGECLSVMAGMEEASVDLILCDLPYGTTMCEWDSVIPLDELWKQYRRVAKPNAAIVLTADQPFTSALIMSNVNEFRYCWTWKKGHSTGFMNAKKMPLKNTEDVCVFYRKLPTYNPQGTRRARITSVNPVKQAPVYGKTGIKPNKGHVQDTTNYPTQVLPFSVVEETQHPTQKPVGLMRYLIETYTNPGDVVLDNCMGSGTTGVAAMLSGRGFIGIEREPAYMKICIDRISSAQNPLKGFGAKGGNLEVIEQRSNRVTR